MNIQVQSAANFTLQQLVDIYNQARDDYLIPMPMTLPDLDEYLQVYDISLDGSVVALLDDNPVGLNLLGLRGDQGWITRLGVAADARRQGVARTLMEAMLVEAQNRDVAQVWLEVITDNQPGRALFHSFGFQEVDEFIVAERPDMEPTTLPAIPAAAAHLDRQEMLELLGRREGHVNWKNDTQSLQKLDGLSGLWVQSDQGTAWVIFRPKGDRLEKTLLGVVSGTAREIGWLTLHHLHRVQPGMSCEAENVPADGPMWEAYKRAGYRPIFRRVEMKLGL